MATAAEVQDDAICTICLGYLTEPVTIACGHNFCQACITQCCKEWEKGERPELTCPQCRAQFQKGEFRPNMQLKNIVQKIKLLGINPGKGKEPKVDLCEKHEECLKLFCEEDGEVICWLCEKSRDHKSHTVVPIEEAAPHYKMQLEEALGPLRKKEKHALALTSEEEKKTRKWQSKVKSKREMIAHEFFRLYTLLRQEEQLLLVRLAAEETETLQKLQENVTKLSQQHSSLQQMITEVEETCQKRAVELLKGARSTLTRSRSVTIQEPEAISIDLRDVYKIPECCLDMLKRFGADVTLDPDTANPWLVLSEDRKSVRPIKKKQDLPSSSQRFDSMSIVLGTEKFMGGQHYWEVEVGDKTEWMLGVCRESVRRKGQVQALPKNGYWAISLSDGKYEADTSPSTSLPVSVKPTRVGIFLDYEMGEVSFYNMTDKSHLFTFTDSFSGTICPYFNPGVNSAGKNAGPLIIPAQAKDNLCSLQ